MSPIELTESDYPPGSYHLTVNGTDVYGQTATEIVFTPLTGAMSVLDVHVHYKTLISHMQSHLFKEAAVLRDSMSTVKPH